MSSFSSDIKFARDLTKGYLAEVIFERLAVHAGWWVNHTGDQYHNPISPLSKKVSGGNGTPDFLLTKSKKATKGISVEVKFEAVLNLKSSAHKKKTENFRVVLSPEGWRVYPKSGEEELKITKEDWGHAVSFLANNFKQDK